MDSKCSICHKSIAMISAHNRPIEFDGMTACADCISEAEYNVLFRELKKMKKEG